MLSVPTDEMQLKALKDKNCSEIFHFYFPVKVAKNSDLATSKIDSAIHVLQHMTFDKCSIIIDHTTQECTEVANRFSELGIDAEAFDVQDTEQDHHSNASVSNCKRNVIVNLVEFQPAPATVDAYIRLVGKFVVAGALNLVLNLPEGKRLGLVKEAFGEGPVFVHKLPAEPALWKDLRKLKAAGEAAAAQAIKEITQKIAAGRKVVVAAKNGSDPAIIPTVQIEAVEDSVAQVESGVGQMELGEQGESIVSSSVECGKVHSVEAVECGKGHSVAAVDSCIPQAAQAAHAVDSCTVPKTSTNASTTVPSGPIAPTTLPNAPIASTAAHELPLGVVSSQESLSTSQNAKAPSESKFLPSKIKNSLFKTASSLFSMVSNSKPTSPKA